MAWVGLVGEYQVSEIYKRDFDTLKRKFGKLFVTAWRSLLAKNVSVDSLQTELMLVYTELIPALRNTSTLRQVLCVVRLNCSLINCTYLETVSEYCDLDELDEQIQSYYQTMELFCKHTLSSHKYVVSFLEDHPKYLLCCQRVTFRLQWKTDERTLCDIQALLRNAFKEVAQYIYIAAIDEGSVQVFCRASPSLLGVLVKMAQVTEKSLCDCGVVYLSIGCCVLIDKEAEHKVKKILHTLIM